MRLRIFTEPQQGATYDQQLAVARAAEHLGFDGYFRSDHYLRMGKGDPGPGPTDAWITLAGLARDTSRVRLGTLVIAATFRLPGPLAISFAQVDAMSSGRVELGIGAGWFEDEHRAYGIPFRSTPERFERLEEQLAIITGLWTTPVGKRFSHSGAHYQLADSPALPKPVQQPHPPIIIGGYGTKRTPSLAARYAQEFNLPFPPVEVYREYAARVRQACADAGRDPASLHTTVAVSCVADAMKPSSGVAPRPSAASRTRCARTAPPGSPTRSSRGCTRSGKPAPRPPTSSCSTSPTSTTFGLSRPR